MPYLWEGMHSSVVYVGLGFAKDLLVPGQNPYLALFFLKQTLRTIYFMTRLYVLNCDDQHRIFVPLV